MIPFVIEKDGGRERSYDIYSRLLKDRIIFVGGVISDPMANAVCAQLLFLSMNDGDEDVNIYINSPGGSITAGMAILDTMAFIPCKVNTFGIGQCASMGALLLSQGDKRYALPHSRIMMHQPSGGASGTAADIVITTDEIIRLRTMLNEILADKSGKTVEEIEKLTDRDYYMSPEEAKGHGFIDEIITSFGEDSE